ncbi:putative xylosidase/arabinosidase [Ilyonectria destructans]|nr:putative xylosidase/arabinosidase [Ilyonectria destructans]
MAHPNVNPTILGIAPDPSIIFVQDTFFLVTSSFHLFPGLPIYASKDLLTWQHIGNAINRTSQLSITLSETYLNSDGSLEWDLATGGLYAPTIRHKDGVTYIACTNVIHTPDSKGTAFENFVIWTSDIWSNEWSDPVTFDFHGIDPDIFFDDCGRCYIVGSAWGASTTINCFQLDLLSGKALSPERILWEGPTKKIPESPHLYKKDSWYYLLISEGGTSENHHLTIARSRDLWGPYETSPDNSIINVSDPDRYFQHIGHGDLVLDGYGQWWLVCLGLRKDDKRYIMGREIFLSAVYWPQDQWPFLEPVHNDFDTPQGLVTFMGQRQRCLLGTATATLIHPFSGTELFDKAALAYRKDENRFVRLHLYYAQHNVILHTFNRPKGISRKITIGVDPERSLTFRWKLVGMIDTTDMTKVNFVGPVIGVFATSQ